MRTCQKCNREIEENVAVCPYCGHQQKRHKKQKRENRLLTPKEQDVQDRKYLVILLVILALLVYFAIRQFIF
ncbi:MAG TPA: zinc-ribbon domain-containing protein [Levilinea sp.]|nr:zinc-ribbon domain-containing protein [Levilinea sp.]